MLRIRFRYILLARERNWMYLRSIKNNYSSLKIITRCIIVPSRRTRGNDDNRSDNRFLFLPLPIIIIFPSSSTSLDSTSSPTYRPTTTGRNNRRILVQEIERKGRRRRRSGFGTASALFFYAPRWPQTTELNQLKFNPEPGGSRRSPFGHLSSLFTFPPIFFSSFLLLSRLSLCFTLFPLSFVPSISSNIFSIFSIYIYIYIHFIIFENNIFKPSSSSIPFSLIYVFEN